MVFKQLSLFSLENRDLREQIAARNHIRSFHTNIQESGFDYQEFITFKGGQVESVHRWYRLTPSYSPNSAAPI